MDAKKYTLHIPDSKKHLFNNASSDIDLITSKYDLINKSKYFNIGKNKLKQSQDILNRQSVINRFDLTHDSRVPSNKLLYTHTESDKIINKGEENKNELEKEFKKQNDVENKILTAYSIKPTIKPNGDNFPQNYLSFNKIDETLKSLYQESSDIQNYINLINETLIFKYFDLALSKNISFEECFAIIKSYAILVKINSNFQEKYEKSWRRNYQLSKKLDLENFVKKSKNINKILRPPFFYKNKSKTLPEKKIDSFPEKSSNLNNLIYRYINQADYEKWNKIAREKSVLEAKKYTRNFAKAIQLLINNGLDAGKNTLFRGMALPNNKKLDELFKEGQEFCDQAPMSCSVNINVSFIFKKQNHTNVILHIFNARAANISGLRTSNPEYEALAMPGDKYNVLFMAFDKRINAYRAVLERKEEEITKASDKKRWNSDTIKKSIKNLFSPS